MGIAQSKVILRIPRNGGLPVDFPLKCGHKSGLLPHLASRLYSRVYSHVSGHVSGNVSSHAFGHIVCHASRSNSGHVSHHVSCQSSPLASRLWSFMTCLAVPVVTTPSRFPSLVTHESSALLFTRLLPHLSSRLWSNLVTSLLTRLL